MKLVIGILLIASTAIAGNCDLSSDLEPRILGGHVATPHGFPYAAAMFLNGKYECGASIIGPSHLLTAAHCIEDPEVDNYSISLGDNNIFIPDGETLYDVDKLIRHPYFDIAIIKLKVPADRRVTPDGKYIIDYALLPNSDDFDADEVPIVAGWGDEVPNGPQVANLKFFKSTYRRVTEFTVIIAGGMDGAACNGDSGSGVVHQRNKSFHLAGIISRPFDRVREKPLCTLDTLAFRVDKQMDWIRSVMAEE